MLVVYTPIRAPELDFASMAVSGSGLGVEFGPREIGELQMQASVAKEMQQLGDLMVKEKEEDLSLFLEMQKRDKDRDDLFLNNSEEFDDPLGSSPDDSRIFNITSAIPARKAGADDFLDSENDKNDYDWLLTPPGTPLFPSLELEPQRTIMSQIGTPKDRPTATKSRLSNPKPEPAERSSLVSKPPASSPGLNPSSAGTRRPSSSGGPRSRPATPTGRPILPSASKPSRSSTPTSRATLHSTRSTLPSNRSAASALPSASKPSRSSTPTSRATLPSTRSTLPSNRSAASATKLTSSAVKTTATVTKPTATTTKPTTTVTKPTATAAKPTASATKPTVPSRSSTPLSRSTARSSTPTSRPSLPPPRSTSRASTPTPRLSTPSSTPSVARPLVKLSSVTKPAPAASKDSLSSHVTFPTVKSRLWKPSEIPGFSNDTPPNLKTSAPERPLSASRGRPGAPSPRSSSVEPGPPTRPRRQSCSPSRGRPPNGVLHPSGGSVPAVSRGHLKPNDNVNPVLYGTKMVERVINMRKLVPPKQEDKHSPQGYLSAKSSSPENMGFGRTLSKKSLDMAMRHMDIRKTIPGNLRKLMTNIHASSMYSVRSGPTHSRTVSVSDSPHATSSNASSEVSVNNHWLNFDASELEDDIVSDGIDGRSPASLRGRAPERTRFEKELAEDSNE